MMLPDGMDTPGSLGSIELEKNGLSNIKSIPPQEQVDGGYGWVCVAGMLLITTMTFGINGVNDTLL
jgi:hypothetical protein